MQGLMLYVCVVLSSRLWAVTLAQGCPPERPGECSEVNTTNNNTAEVLSFCSLNCEFDTDLCNYTQGCRDEGMTSWVAENGSAIADQEEAFVCGRRSFSILESNWVNFTATLTCLQFQFMRHLPYDLDVFLVPFNNVGDVQTLRNRIANESEGIYSYNFTVPQMVGKVLFRLYGGGGFSGNGSRRLLQLHSVSAVEGGCTPPVCSSQNLQELCGWDAVNLEASQQANSTIFSVNNTDTPASMTLPLTRATGVTLTDCLTFQYKVKGINSQLNVTVLLLDGSKITVWSVDGRGLETNWTDGSVPVTTASAYRIIFEAQKSLSSDEVSLSTVTVTSSSLSSSCTSYPPEAATGLNISNTSFSTCDPLPEIETTELPTTTTTITTLPTVITSQPSTTVLNIITTDNTTTASTIANTIPTTTDEPTTTAAATTIAPTEEPTTTSTINITTTSNELATTTSSLTTSRQSETTTVTSSDTTAERHQPDNTTEQPVTTTGTTQTTGSAEISTVSTGRRAESTATRDVTQATSTPGQTPRSEGRDGEEKDDESLNDGVIAGVVVAVMVIIAVIVIAIIIWRRKSMSSNTYSFGRDKRHGPPIAMTETIKNSSNRYDTL